jgi:hypothetical protein
VFNKYGVIYNYIKGVFMSEDEDYRSDEEPIWEETVEAPKETIHEQPLDALDYSQTQPEGLEETIDPETAAKKKRRRTILIVVFAIVLPAVLLLTGLGFLIWGLVVGFTNCCQSCENCFNECFSCCDACNNCGNCCSDCSDTCTNCCGSESVNNSSPKLLTKIQLSLKLTIQNAKALVKWYYYTIVQFIQSIFSK